MNIISIDFSKVSTGIFTCVNKKESWHTIKIKDSIKLPDALCILYDKIGKLLDDKKYDYGLIEWIYRGESLLKISGVICLVFAQHKVPLVQVPAMTWKSILDMCKVDKKHNLDKYLDGIKTIYGRSFATTDEADAFLMYHAVKNIENTDKISPVITKIKKQLLKINLDNKIKA
jgi:Holliday junction resolvasome RuvABC endonuclease subunit